MVLTPLPTYVQIEPVGQCNLRCQMCSIQFRADGPPYGPPAFMPFERFVAMLDALPDLQELHLQGLGEPMMHPRFFDMVSYAAAKGVQVTTNSNATLLNERRAERCVASGLACLHVSLDGANAATYERIRVRAHFDRVTANVERLLATRERLGASTPRLRLVMVLMRQNLDELPDIVRIAHRWHADSMFVQHLCHDFGESSLPAHYRPMRAFVEEQTLLGEDERHVDEVFASTRELAQRLDVDLRLPRPRARIYPPGTPGRQRCDWPWRGAYVSYDGHTMPCCMVSTPDRVNFGKIEPDGFVKVWNNREYEAFRQQLASDEPPEICRSCALYAGTF
jgi:radical SAM protein with 4Fe4S-binding SPASM domain